MIKIRSNVKQVTEIKQAAFGRASGEIYGSEKKYIQLYSVGGFCPSVLSFRCVCTGKGGSQGNAGPSSCRYGGRGMCLSFVYCGSFSCVSYDLYGDRQASSKFTKSGGGTQECTACNSPDRCGGVSGVLSDISYTAYA